MVSTEPDDAASLPPVFPPSLPPSDVAPSCCRLVYLGFFCSSGLCCHDPFSYSTEKLGGLLFLQWLNAALMKEWFMVGPQH